MKALACIGAIVVAAAGLVAWYFIKVWSFDVLREISIFPMPLLIGAGIGLTMRLLCKDGTFGLASFAIMLTVMAGFIGGGIQQRLDFDRRLRKMVTVAYEETLDFATRTAAATNDLQLRWMMSDSEIAAVGRLIPTEPGDSPAARWARRNFCHLNWIAARNITIYGQGGTDKSIWRTTQVLKGDAFLDSYVAGRAKQPVSDNEVAALKDWDLPYFKKVTAKEISQTDFEGALISKVQARTNWLMMAADGCGIFLGMCMLWGCVAAYKLVRRADPAEII